jgi:uncharacterized iron-regulated protein
MIELQREVYGLNQARIEGEPNAAFKRYEREYKRRVTRYQATSSFDALLDAALTADIIYVGDYHTLAQAQQTVVRLLRRFPLDRQPTVALELVPTKEQPSLDALMAGRIEETEFLRRIACDAEGIFSAYKPIFDFCGDHRLPMIGIDADGAGLAAHDRHAAEQIVSALEQRPNKTIIVLASELHVAPGHLPAAVDEALRRRKLGPKKRLVIYQNCEALYWQIERMGLERSVDVLRVKNDEYCVLGAPPIVAQQSCSLDADDALFDTERPETTFKDFAQQIADALKIDLDDALDGVAVSTVVDPYFLSTLRRRAKFTEAELADIRAQVLRGESYFIPKANMVFLGMLTVNHAAEEASHFLRHVCAGDDEPRYLVDAFYCRALNEAMGFLGSKIINPKRTCLQQKDFQRIAKDKSRHPFEARVAALVVKHGKMEQGVTTRNVGDLYTTDADTFNALTHAIGYLLGDKLYRAMQQDLFGAQEARALFYEALHEDGAALSTYLALASRLKKF